MPRAGDGTYSKPAGTTAVSGTTIASATYNSTIDDLATDANTPRPVVSGGTGASTAAGARANLAAQQVNAALTSISGLTTAAGQILRTTAANTYTTLGISDTAIANIPGFASEYSGSVDAVTALAGMRHISASVTGTKPVSSYTELNIPRNVTNGVGSVQLGIGVFSSAIYARGKPDASWSAWSTYLPSIDEDDMASDSAVRCPTQQSVKAYVDTTVAGSALGAGQTWQDVSASRAVSTTYQNTTGKPIMVNVSGDNGLTLQISTDASTWVTVGSAPSATRNNLSAIVPSTHYYRTQNANAVTWAELR